MAVTVEYKYKGIHVVAGQSIDVEYVVRGTDDYGWRIEYHISNERTSR